ncbi:PatB family C-S lyase [Lentisphaerota bacterium WC36G]|nr:PatB family C-S lyase [Lentisphaerae bacterium WC36]
MANFFDKVVNRKDSHSLKWDKYQCKDIIPMWVADMDFPSSPAITEALQKRAEHGIFGYTLEPKELKDAIVEMYKRDFNWDIKSEWLVMLPSVVSALNTCAWVFAGPNKSVLTVKPVYHPFFLAPVHAGSKMNLSTLKMAYNTKLERDEYVLNFKELEEVTTPDTSLWIFCNPHNPVGKVFTREELEQVADFVLKHDLVLCCDEIHSGLVLDEEVRHIPIASLSEEIANRTITLNAPSKTFNIAGLNFGFAIIPNAELRKRFAVVNDGFSPYVNLFAYEAALQAYTNSSEWYNGLIAYLRENRNIVEEFVNNNEHLSLEHSQATYLSWIDITKLQLDEPTQYFEQYGVGFNDGRIFGKDGFIRLNFGCPKKLLLEGLKRLENAVNDRMKMM